MGSQEDEIQCDGDLWAGGNRQGRPRLLCALHITSVQRGEIVLRPALKAGTVDAAHCAIPLLPFPRESLCGFQPDRRSSLQTVRVWTLHLSVAQDPKRLGRVGKISVLWTAC